MSQSNEPGLLVHHRVARWSTLSLIETRTSQPDTDDLWARALQEALVKLPPKDAEWLSNEENRKAFTSTQIVEAIRPYHKKYSKRLTQRFLAWIDPIVSHIRSFAGAISTLTNADPTGAGVVWGCIQLVLIVSRVIIQRTLNVAGKSQQDLHHIVTVLSDLSPQLALFTTWHRLFPEKPFAEVSNAIKDTYVEVIAFSTSVLTRDEGNLLRTIFAPTLEQKLQAHQALLRRYTSRVRAEVDTAHMQSVKSQLETIYSLIDGSPTPRYTELPPIRIIPHLRNDGFFGRQKILDQMGGKLLPSSTQHVSRKQNRFALSGLGGSGKTQIALEFTYRHLDKYRVVIWLLADNIDKINQSFEETAELLGLRKGTQSASQIRAFVMQRLSTSNEPYLLCFDNADDISLISDWLPRDNKGTILVTSRDSVGTREVIGEGETVLEFSIAEGSDFLASILQVGTTEKPMLEQISTAFHGYPLALAQAAAFIRSGGCPLGRFLDIFQNEHHHNAIASLPVKDYHATLFTVWNLSFQSLSPQSQQILEILVYFDPDSVPVELFERGCVPKKVEEGVSIDLSYLANPVELWAAFKGLRSQSLIKTNTELQTISIHRFLQDQTFKRLCSDPSRRRKAFEESLFLLSNHQPEFPNITQHWSPDLFKDSEACLSHISMLAQRFWEFPEAFAGLENKLGRLIFEGACYKFERFHHSIASDTFALARKVISKASTPDELFLSDCYRMEGRMFNESGQATSGAESNRQARHYALLAIQKGYIGHDDQRMPRILTGLGNSLSQLNMFDEALDYQLEAKRLCGDVPPDQSDAITIIQLNLGFLLYRRGDLETAEKILRATLDANPRTPPAMYALGNTLLARGLVEEAIAAHLNGLEIYIEMFGDEHALVGRCVYKVGEILLLHKKDAKTARIYLHKATKIYLKQESPYYTVKANARATRMLAKAFDMEGRGEEAKRYYEQAWNLRENIDGTHGSVADTDEDYSAAMFYWDK
ncbi:hypothetical protein J7337_011088 [Fusarium musae]|uniref:DUF7779 domain-containing protein n=1 Tax=Fusarium musae TaxID=1042133 RepID=A0A9P8DAA7_9HYPO|nr:hypothetical protein J7337_011088 [Fusarium musae]KAG9498193.1 hypothetical protein J7337_011088 [Fusarium musae]